MTTATITSPHIRWMIRRDMPEVLTIEWACFLTPWNERDFALTLKALNTIGQVAEVDGHVAGYMVYSLHCHHIELLNLAVAPWHQREGIGARLIAKLVAKLTPQRRRYIRTEVRETNLDAQLFFRANGFELAQVLFQPWADAPDEDGYAFVRASNT